MRSIAINRFKENIGIFNDYLTYYVFISYQMILEKDNLKSNTSDYKKLTIDKLKKYKNKIKDYTNYSHLLNIKDLLLNNADFSQNIEFLNDKKLQLELNELSSNPKIFINEILKENIFSEKFNKEINEIENWAKKTDEFIFDSILAFIYLQIEIYLKEVYLLLQKACIVFNKKELQLKYISNLKINNNSEEIIKKRILRLQEDLLKIGRKLNYTIDIVKSDDIKNERSDFSLKDLNTDEPLTTILENLQLIEYNNTLSKYILNKINICITQQDIDTLEYFRLRRNTVVHRDYKNRFKGTIKSFINNNGISLNEYWKIGCEANKDRKFKVEHFDFENENLVFKNFDELIEILNIIRYICIKIDKLFLNLFDESEWLIVLFESFLDGRKGIKPTDLTDIDRFYSKFCGYTRNELNFEFEETRVKDNIELYRKQNK